VRAGHGIRAEFGKNDRLAELLMQLVEFVAERLGCLIEPPALRVPPVVAIDGNDVEDSEDRLARRRA
jgi:hypothetical protein